MNYEEAVRNVSIAISIDNHQRPHGSIDYLKPIEAHFRSGEFKRRWKNYYSKKTEKDMKEVFQKASNTLCEIERSKTEQRGV